MNATLNQVNSPVGKLKIISDEKYLLAVLWEDDSFDRIKLKDINIKELKSDKKNQIFIKTKIQLEEYFSGSRKKFDIPVKFQGSDFQTNVWNELKKIGYADTKSYKDIAQKINNPKSSRAVGLANSKNPISIIIPCHRVIGSNGKLTGFAGGLSIKQKLLELELSYSYIENN